MLVMMLHFNVIASPTGLLDRVLLHGAGAGWVGVDLFFVLSGFLITGILYRSRNEPGYFRNFYARRSLRIFPLYYAALAVTFLLLPVFLSGSRILNELRADQGWYWAYLSNVRVAEEGFPASLTIGHFWSLAIEEQFYLVWPLVVFLLPRRQLLAVALAMIAGALVLRSGLILYGHTTAAYVLAPARMDGLALGAALAILGHHPKGLERLGRLVLPVLGVTASLLAGIFVLRHGLFPHDAVVQTAGYTLLSCFFGAVLAAAVRAVPGTPLNRALTARPLLFFGKYSYGIYVFHQPISGMLKRGLVQPGILALGSPWMTQLAFTTLATALSVAAALVSWNLLEKHFLKLKGRFEAPRPEIKLDLPGPVPLGMGGNPAV